MAGKFESIVGSKEGEYSSSIIILAAITDQVGVPQEVSVIYKNSSLYIATAVQIILYIAIRAYASCCKVEILTIVHDRQYNNYKISTKFNTP